MEKDIIIRGSLKVVDAKNKNNICYDCVLCIGSVFCANRSLCPDEGDGKNLMWSSKPEEVSNN